METLTILTIIGVCIFQIWDDLYYRRKHGTFSISEKNKYAVEVVFWVLSLIYWVPKLINYII